MEIEKLDEAAKLDPESLNSSDVPSKVGSWAWAGRRANTKQNIWLNPAEAEWSGGAAHGARDTEIDVLRNIWTGGRTDLKTFILYFHFTPTGSGLGIKYMEHKSLNMNQSGSNAGTAGTEPLEPRVPGNVGKHFINSWSV